MLACGRGVRGARTLTDNVIASCMLCLGVRVRERVFAQGLRHVGGMSLSSSSSSQRFNKSDCDTSARSIMEARRHTNGIIPVPRLNIRTHRVNGRAHDTRDYGGVIWVTYFSRGSPVNEPTRSTHRRGHWPETKMII